MEPQDGSAIQARQSYRVHIKPTRGPDLSQLYPIVIYLGRKLGVLAIENVGTKLTDDQRRNARVAIGQRHVCPLALARISHTFDVFRGRRWALGSI
jgi:hypothetical protein